ncbi:MAG TPA: iron-sulfur cluster assembly protein [candidate division Zixibacteria bacterium]|nr:iron-sulfur cluster assembly protein [candidate division Zixibacteria bacterium]
MPLPTNEEILTALKPVLDPEIGLGLVDLGLIYDVMVEPDGKVKIKMTLTTPACPYGETLLHLTHEAAASVDGVTEVEITLVWDPPWNPREMASDLAKDVLGIW